MLDMNIDHSKTSFLLFGFLTASLALLIITATQAYATDIPIEGYVEGGISLSISGDWNTGLNFSNAIPMDEDQTVYWDSVDNEDYMDFADDTTTPGFYITLSVSDFTYTGPSTSQSNLGANKFSLIGEYSGSPAAPSIGSDDPTKNISILPTSCGSITVSNFTFHGSFTTSPYTLSGSNSNRTLMESDGTCLNIGHLRFDRAEFSVPSQTDIGTYTSSFTITMIDGTP